MVPKTTNQMVKEYILSEKATVITHGSHWEEANIIAKKISQSENAFYIHPFDNPLLWEGYSTIIQEAKSQIKPPGAIILSVGGGGFLCGVYEGLKKVGWTDIPIIATETHGTHSFNLSLNRSNSNRLKSIKSIASSLGSPYVCEQLLKISKKANIISYVVTDQEAVTACSRFARDHHFLVEPACGAALSIVYNQILKGQQYSSLLILVCGGNNLQIFEGCF